MNEGSGRLRLRNRGGLSRTRDVWLKAAILASLGFGTAHGVTAPDPEALVSLTLEQLGEVRVTSVSKEEESLLEAPASVFVIEREEILRSGAATLAEALRLAPNLLVARISASQYAISARGFNNSIGNKLLVLVDGRTIYTPLFSGVQWDSQQVLLEDVERIEVISGPGAALWGANAVNGVINVTTLPAAKTVGAYASAQGSEQYSRAAARFGAASSPNSFRVYGFHHRDEPSENAAGDDLLDEWELTQGGFRSDWSLGQADLTVQGDAYEGEGLERPLFGAVEVSGAYLRAHWARPTGDRSKLQLSAYYDRSERIDRLSFDEQLEIADIELQQDLELGRHGLVWGGGYRHAVDDTKAGLLATLIPERRALEWGNAFAQVDLSLPGRVRLLAGARLEHNDYTGTEFLPTLRASWKPADDHLLWASLSRAVRAPARIDREFYFPGAPPFLIAGGPEFESEIADVLEVGFRSAPGTRGSYSVTAFHHEFDRLRSGEPYPDGFRIANGIEGSTTGVEAWGSFQPLTRLRFIAGFLVLDQDLELASWSRDPTGPSALGNDPDFQANLRVAFSASERLDFDLMLRHVASLPSPRVPSYSALDARVGWTFNGNFAASLILKNLNGGHAEFQPGILAQQSEFDRSVGVRIRWHR
jgi:iron complex outermembrane receptor protein